MVLSSYNHQSHRKAEACVNIVKRMLKKCIHTNTAIFMSLLQIASTPIALGLPSLASLLFNGPTQGLLPRFNGLPLGYANDENIHAKLLNRQQKTEKDKDTHISISPLTSGLIVPIYHKDG